MVKYSFRALLFSFYFFVISTAGFIFCATMFSSISDTWHQFFIKLFDLLLKSPDKMPLLLFQFYLLHLAIFIILTLGKRAFIKIKKRKQTNTLVEGIDFIGEENKGFLGHVPIEKK